MLRLEVGRTYLTRCGEFEVRIISSIGKWSKKHPYVGELYRIAGKVKRVFEEGIFERYEHWTSEGIYLQKGSESSFDLVAEVEVVNGKRTAIKPGTQGTLPGMEG